MERWMDGRYKNNRLDFLQSVSIQINRIDEDDNLVWYRFLNVLGSLMLEKRGCHVLNVSREVLNLAYALHSEGVRYQIDEIPFGVCLISLPDFNGGVICAGNTSQNLADAKAVSKLLDFDNDLRLGSGALGLQTWCSPTTLLGRDIEENFDPFIRDISKESGEELIGILLKMYNMRPERVLDVVVAPRNSRDEMKPPKLPTLASTIKPIYHDIDAEVVKKNYIRARPTGGWTVRPHIRRGHVVKRKNGKTFFRPEMVIHREEFEAAEMAVQE